MTSHTLDRFQACILRLAIAIEEGCLKRSDLPPLEATEITMLATVLRDRARAAARGRHEDAIELICRDGFMIETVKANP